MMHSAAHLVVTGIVRDAPRPRSHQAQLGLAPTANRQNRVASSTFSKIGRKWPVVMPEGPLAAPRLASLKFFVLVVQIEPRSCR